MYFYLWPSTSIVRCILRQHSRAIDVLDVGKWHFSNDTILTLFSDDAKLSNSAHFLLQQDLDQLYTWINDGDLLFSINKCIHLSFNNNTLISYSVTHFLS